ncbi:flavodoxin [Pseudoflavonifractor phocaeensis]|uniref:flavodoxin n=1 Tax=Pseudoflavonifractor phocaeensis TaxID=1870988 RepID=UPI00195CE0AA|nr:flavodoxin [Pseudoflavonifractor phocaeensis]MBM6869881.1 flavodoxin [Pseudoflavonifractor phocaeensis]
MSKMAVIFWSGTGNTEAMANAVAEGAKNAGAEVVLLPVSAVSAEEAAGYDVLALGCPAMGAEVLEESEFEPFFAALEGKLAGKPVALFGSYGWGDGQWMRDWEERTRAAGAVLKAQPLMVNETPDDDALSDCRALGAAAAV